MADNLLVSIHIYKLVSRGYLDEPVIGVHERFTFHLINISCIIYKSDEIHMPPEFRNSETQELCENKATERRGGYI
jgi:hypothetical protein